MYDKYNQYELRLLPFFLSRIEKKIYDLVKARETNQSGKLQALKYKRNVLRKVLLKKLTKWKEDVENNPQRREPELTYSKVLEIEEELKIKNKMEGQKEWE